MSHHFITYILILSLVFVFTTPSVMYAQLGGIVTGSENNSENSTAVPVEIMRVNKDADTLITNTLKNIETSISSAETARNTDFLRFKEDTLDGISRKLAQSANDQMFANILSYVNGGEDGGTPAFVSDYRSYIQQAKDEAGREFIYGSEAETLGPNSFDARVSGLEWYVANERGAFSPRYTLESVCEDAEAFAAGVFSAGGWECFREMMFESPANHPVTAEIAFRQELEERIDEAEKQALTKANWGDGFLPKEVVHKIPDASGNTVTRRETVTPGAVIRDAVAFHVGERPAQELIAADELDEVLDALSQQITTLSVTNATGMLGLGGNERYSDNRFGESGSESYLSALETKDPFSNMSLNTKRVTDALAAEEIYHDMQDEIVSTVADFEKRIDIGETNAPSCFSISLPDELQTDKEDAEANLEVSELLISVLTEMVVVLNDDTSTGSERANILQQFAVLVEEELIRTERENTAFRTEFFEQVYQPRADAFEAKLADEESTCDIEKEPALTS